MQYVTLTLSPSAFLSLVLPPLFRYLSISPPVCLLHHEHNRYIVATTTTWSGVSYLYTKDAVKILTAEERAERAQRAQAGSSGPGKGVEHREAAGRPRKD